MCILLCFRRGAGIVIPRSRRAIASVRFVWKRQSADTTADSVWDDAHQGMKSIELTTKDVLYSAPYSCEILEK